MDSKKMVMLFLRRVIINGLNMSSFAISQSQMCVIQDVSGHWHAPFHFIHSLIENLHQLTVALARGSGCRQSWGSGCWQSFFLTTVNLSDGIMSCVITLIWIHLVKPWPRKCPNLLALQAPVMIWHWMRRLRLPAGSNSPKFVQYQVLPFHLLKQKQSV